MNSDPTFIETVIVGGGPIGIETAVELRRRGVDAEVIEAGPVGNTVAWWAPATRWFSSNDRIAIAGVPLNTVDQSKASREEYLNYLRTVVDQYQVPIASFERVQKIEPVLDPVDRSRWRLTTSRNGAAYRTIHCCAVVLAIGGTDFPNRLNVPGESLSHVDGYLREVHRYYGRNVLIVGGRNSAVEAAIRLQRVGANVTLSYHRASLPDDGIKYWLRPEIEGLIRSESVRAIFDSRVIEIEPTEAVLMVDNAPGTDRRVRIACDDLLTLIGYQQDQTLFESLGILTDDASPKPIYDPSTMQTPREGIYVAGTAVGGTQSSKYQVFLENCHDHSVKIANHLGGSRGNDGLRNDALEAARLPTADWAAIRDRLDQRIAMQPES